MILSASYRTDIPAYYGRWLLGRLSAGSVMVANPYGGKPARLGLGRDAVDGIVFWTKNPIPFEAGFEAVAALGHPFVIQLGINAYPRALERSVPDPDAAIGCASRLAARFSPRAIVWRYDPIVISSLTPPDWHTANFARLARALRGTTDEVVTSFVQPYRKTARNLGAALRAANATWRHPDAAEKRAILDRLHPIAGENGMRLTLCTQPDLAGGKTPPARCIDAERLSDVAGRAIGAPERGNRPGCLCHASRDIGAYDSCPQGCAYCYAVESQAKARLALGHHDPAAAFLIPPDRSASC
ncbi:MAG: DUF1848 domain-containing protein [Alphaproteobacteria bacterium]